MHLLGPNISFLVWLIILLMNPFYYLSNQFWYSIKLGDTCMNQQTSFYVVYLICLKNRAASLSRSSLPVGSSLTNIWKYKELINSWNAYCKWNPQLGQLIMNDCIFLDLFKMNEIWNQYLKNIDFLILCLMTHYAYH